MKSERRNHLKKDRKIAPTRILPQLVWRQEHSLPKRQGCPDVLSLMTDMLILFSPNMECFGCLLACEHLGASRLAAPSPGLLQVFEACRLIVLVGFGTPKKMYIDEHIPINHIYRDSLTQKCSKIVVWASIM